MAAITSRSRQARCSASLQRFPFEVSREGAGHGGCARATPKRTPPSQVSRTWSSRAPPEPSLGEDKGMKVVLASRGTPEHRDSGA